MSVNRKPAKKMVMTGYILARLVESHSSSAEGVDCRKNRNGLREQAESKGTCNRNL